MPSAIAEASADAPVPPARRLKKEDAGLLASVDATVDRMRKTTPQDPYLVTIPHDHDLEPEHIYRHEYRFHAYQHLHNTPFQRGESDSIQYQTFHFYEPGSDIYVLHNTAFDERPRDEVPRTGRAPGTASNTPNLKKISLDAYKKKQAGGKSSDTETKATNDSAAKQPAVKGPIERVKETEQMLAAVADNEPSTTETTNKKDLKRKHNGAETLVDRTEDTVPAAKRPRKSSPALPISQLAKKQVGTLVTDRTPRSPPHKVPATASQPAEIELPPRLSPLQVDSLPARLSPTLPDNIRVSLEVRERARKAEKMSKEKPGQATKSKAAKAGYPQRNDSHVGSSPHVASCVRSPPPPVSQGEEIAVEGRASKSSQRPKSVAIVKLKYKKSNRKVVRDILRLRPKPWSAVDLASKGLNIEHITDHGLPEATKNALNAEKAAAAKLGAPKDTAKGNAPEQKSYLNAARSKVDEVSRTGPSTPMAPRVNSPAVSKASSQVTPGMRKEATSVAMRREQSNDSHINTPSAQSQNTPATSQPNGTMKAPPSQPSNKTPLQQAWEKEQKDLDSLGRDLKHAATSHLSNASDSGRRLAAIKSVESLLCYVFAFTCAEEAARSSDPKGTPPLKLWRSLPPFVGFVRKYCDNYPVLQGIASLIAVSINSRLIEITSTKKGDVLPVEKVLEVSSAMQRAAKEAEEVLELDRIMSVFPRTWAARTVGSGIVTSKLPNPRKLGGPYKLPVSLQTPPILAGRACYAMLEEWVRKQTGIEYKLTLRVEG